MFNFIPPNINQIITACFIALGLYLDAKLFWMVIYEIKYGTGEEYLMEGKSAAKRQRKI